MVFRIQRWVSWKQRCFQQNKNEWKAIRGKKLVAFFCFKNRDLLKSYCNKRIRKVIINDNGWQRSSIHYEKKKGSHMNQQEIFTYIQKQYPTHPDTINKSGYPVTIFKNPRTAAPYAIFYQPAERTTFMEVQAEPDMIGNRQYDRRKKTGGLQV